MVLNEFSPVAYQVLSIKELVFFAGYPITYVGHHVKVQTHHPTPTKDSLYVSIRSTKEKGETKTQSN